MFMNNHQHPTDAAQSYVYLQYNTPQRNTTNTFYPNTMDFSSTIEKMQMGQL